MNVVQKLTQKEIDNIYVLIEIVSWSERHFDIQPHGIQFVEMIKKDKEGLVSGLRESLKGK